MKREIAAAILLLLLILGAVWNLRTADHLLESVEYSLRRAEQAARQGDYETALRCLEDGRRCWRQQEAYVQVFFRHPDLDGIQDGFAGLEQALLQEDPGWPAALRLLRGHLESANQMEHPSLGTVF